MSPDINRRDFLRLAGLLPLSLAAPRWTRRLPAAGGAPNVIVLVFDALSAYHLSMYGYPRETMPNLTRLAERGIVYHNHYAASSFTTPGTASLLTGTLPWTHRAIRGGGRVADELVSHNLFDAFAGYYRLGYSHNSWVETLLRQFSGSIQQLIPRDRLYLGGGQLTPVGLFPSDDDIATVSWNRYIEGDGGHAYSLFLSRAQQISEQESLARHAAGFPEGLPGTTAKQPFLMEDAVKWFRAEVPQLPQPFLAYLHFLPPHAPYRPSSEFYGRFAHDGLQFPKKPLDIFHSPVAPVDQSKRRETYDEFLLYADKALGEFCKSLETSGLLENTWLVFTSDHGEMFERGILEHGGEALYEPIIRVPLLVLEPGRQQRLDVHGVTSAVDVLPTLAHVTGQAVPAWAEGGLLPPFGTPAAGRATYAVRCRESDPVAPLKMASTVLVRGSYKLHYYFGYPVLKGADLAKLYDVQADPEEMNDLAAVQKDVTAAMVKEVKAKIVEVNKPYE
jgi:arylsulfatase A-like enzyme